MKNIDAAKEITGVCLDTFQKYDLELIEALEILEAIKLFLVKRIFKLKDMDEAAEVLKEFSCAEPIATKLKS